MGTGISMKEAEDVDSRAAKIIAELGAHPLVDVLRALQQEEGCLTESSLRELAANRMISLTRLYGIATSWPEFRFEAPREEERPRSPAGELPEPLGAVARGGAPGLLVPGSLTARFGEPPQDLAAYEAAGGMRALRRALTEMKPEQALSEVVLGGLTDKPEDWQRAEAGSKEPLIVINCHSGDPLAHQAGELLRKDPYAVLEGAFIGAVAAGARRGYIFLDPRDAPLKDRLTEAAGSVQREADIDFAVEAFVGPDSLVGSVDSVAAAAIGGNRPVPAAVPEDIAIKGIQGQPVLVDSAECFASIAATLAEGRRVESRIFQVTGAVPWEGLVEAEYRRMSVDDLIAEAGAPRGSQVLIGGLAGQILSGRFLELPLPAFQRGDNPRWRTVHVFGETEDRFGLAAQLAACNARHLCGHCIPCRIGSVRMAEMMGAGRVDRETLEEVAITVEKTGLCSAGRGAAALVMSVIENGLFCTLSAAGGT